MISLEGEWQFQLGYEDSMPCEVPFEDSIQIPGILQAQGYGEDITEHTEWVSSLHDPLWYIRGEYRRGQTDGVNIPFLAQPPKHYLGAAWYRRSVRIEEEGEYRLEIECTRWKTEAYIDGRAAGTELSLCAPHHFMLGRLTAGEHILTVKVDNQMQYPYRPDGHGVSDALGAVWNGMAGRVALSRIPEVSIQNVVIKPEADSRQLTVRLSLENKTGMAVEAELCLNVLDENSGRQRDVTRQLKISGAEEQTEIKIDCGKISDCWDEYTKALQHLTITVKSQAGEDKRELPFGFRKIEAKEDGFYINNRPSYLRGTHFGGEFPLTGYPSTKEEDWRRMFLICKDWGLNFIRFHSYCPPDAAFLAADRAGIYLQVECGMWNNFEEGNGMDRVLWEETDRIMKSFGHHPSFLLLSPTNEPGGKWAPVLAEWYRRCRREEKHYSGERLYTRQSGWPYPVAPAEIEDTDYVYFHRSGFGPYGGGTIRNSPGWDGRDYRFSLEGIKYPVITHEMGQWCSYPDFDIIDKFTGYMRPGNYKVFCEGARAAKVLSQNKDFVTASGKMQVQMYKEDLEANFRTPHIYGYELLDLHDYLGQGGALVGVLDAFWDNKGYVKPEEFRHFCNETVLLLRVGRRIFRQGEVLSFPAELSHFGQQELKGMQVSWRIADSRGETVKSGGFERRDYALAKNQEIGVLEIRLAAEEFAAPECYTIELYVEGTELKNSWNIWLYEQEIEIPELKTAVYTRDLKEAKEALEAGKKVVYCPYLSVLDWSCPYLSAKPTFWNAQMGPRWSRGLGILCEESHPALKNFPTRGYQEYQWSEIMRDAKGINLEHYPADFKPIVQPVDEWNRNYKMSLVLEANVGNGSLLLVSADLEKKQKDSLAKQQLLRSLLLYADSEEFKPQNTVSMEVFLKSFADLQVMRRLRASGKLLEYPQEDVSAALDGNPNTTFALEGPGYPYTLELRWEKEEELIGFVYMPVQNQRNHEGDVREYEVFTWNGTAWEEAVRGEFISSFEPKRVFFDREIKTNGLRFAAKSGFGAECVQSYISNKQGWFKTEEALEEKGISIAELALLTKQGALAAEIIEEDGYVGAKTATIEIEE